MSFLRCLAFVQASACPPRTLMPRTSTSHWKIILAELKPSPTFIRTWELYERHIQVERNRAAHCLGREAASPACRVFLSRPRSRQRPEVFLQRAFRLQLLAVV